MGLLDRPDFQAWLQRYEVHHERLHGDGRRPPGNRCDGCGEAMAAPISPTGLCLVCLAEQYGRERARTAGRIAAALRVALAEDRGATPPGDVREAVEDVLEAYEGAAG
jgi:hypothetical protein